MYVPKYRLEAIETIGRKILQEYDRALLEGPPQAVPIEMIIETKFNLILEYHSLRKNGSILGETIFDDGAAILYDRTERQYRLIAVKAGTILIDERLCIDRLLGRMRFTCAHELGHWVLHQKLYSGTGDVAAYDGKTSSDESCGFIERQADALATALLMPIPQVKKCFYRLRPGKSKECLVTEMARIFRVPLGRRIRYIYLSQLLPFLRTAFSLSLGLCWKAGIAAEVIGIPDGSIGERLYESKVYLQTADLFAWTLVIVALSVGFEKCFLYAVDRAVSRLEQS